MPCQVQASRRLSPKILPAKELACGLHIIMCNPGRLPALAKLFGWACTNFQRAELWRSQTAILVQAAIYSPYFQYGR